ncbi:hypothetical protein PS647_06004 [Pseudomonas fluorescens]|nr:hypothetical protein PS647_06004 [Pseudomonas fluorescens]
MFVGAEGMQAEPHVGRRIDRQGVVVAHQHRLAVPHHQQFWRKGAVESPERLVVLNRHVGVKTGVDTFGGACYDRGVRGLVVEPARPEFTDGVVVQLPAVAHAAVELGAGLSGLEGDLWVELVPTLVRPAFSWRTTFGRRAHRMAVEEGFDLRFPRVAVQHVGILRRKRVQPRLAHEGFQRRGRRAAAGDAVRVLRGRRADDRNRESQGRCRQCRVEFFRAEFFEQQQLLSVRLGPEQWAGLAVGGDFEGCLQGWRQHVVGRWRGAGAVHTIGQGVGALVGGRHGFYGIQRGLGVGRRVGIRRRICWRRRADIVKRCCVDDAEADVDQHHSGDARFAEKAERFEVSFVFHLFSSGRVGVADVRKTLDAIGVPVAGKFGGNKKLFDIKRLAVWVLVLMAQ